MKLKIFFVSILFSIVLIGCSDAEENKEEKQPEKEQPEKKESDVPLLIYKGILQLSSKGEQNMTVGFDFAKGTGSMELPDLIPVPLSLTDVKQEGNSVYFTAGFRSGPTDFVGEISGDSLIGVMKKGDLNDPFYLVKSTGELKEAPTYNRKRLKGDFKPIVKPAASDPVTIQLKNGSDAEAKTKAMLEKILEKYELEQYLYTKTILIEDHVIPHSHPTLTLTSGETDENRLLSTFLHEQMHWYCMSIEQLEASQDVFSKLMEKYPEPEIETPRGGGDEFGTYLHLLVNYLEYHTLSQVAGKETADAIFAQLKAEYYQWIYEMVINDMAWFESIAEEAGLHF